MASINSKFLCSLKQYSKPSNKHLNSYISSSTLRQRSSKSIAEGDNFLTCSMNGPSFKLIMQ